MGPGIAIGRSKEAAAPCVRGSPATPESVGYETVRLPVGVVRRHQAETASEVHEGLGSAPGIVRRGFAAIDALRGANVVLTGALSVMHFSQGHTGLGILWGGLSLLWIGLIATSEQSRRKP